MFWKRSPETDEDVENYENEIEINIDDSFKQDPYSSTTEVEELETFTAASPSVVENRTSAPRQEEPVAEGSEQVWRPGDSGNIPYCIPLDKEERGLKQGLGWAAATAILIFAFSNTVIVGATLVISYILYQVVITTLAVMAPGVAAVFDKFASFLSFFWSPWKDLNTYLFTISIFSEKHIIIMDQDWPSNPPLTVVCVLCKAAIPFINGDAERFFRHLLADHQVYFNLNLLLEVSRQQPGVRPSGECRVTPADNMVNKTRSTLPGAPPFFIHFQLISLLSELIFQQSYPFSRWRIFEGGGPQEGRNYTHKHKIDDSIEGRGTREGALSLVLTMYFFDHKV